MEQRKMVFKVLGVWSLAICLTIGVYHWQRRAVHQADQLALMESQQAKLAFAKAYRLKSLQRGAKR